SVAVTARAAVGIVTLILLAAVKVDFGAGAAGITYAYLPEVVCLAHAENMVGSYSDIFCPYVKSLVVIEINRNPQSVNRHFEDFSYELPCVRCGFLFKVISEGEIAEHLKVCAVTGGLSHIVYIKSAYAFLTGGNSRSGRCLFTRKIGLERRHTGVYK